MDYKAIAAKKDQKAIMSHRQRGVIAIDSDGNRTVYSGMSEAARQLTKKTGINFYSTGISCVCSPNRPDAKTYRGYIFEYAGS